MTDSGGAMSIQESGRPGVDQNAAREMGSTQGDSKPNSQTEGQGGMVDAAKQKIQRLASQARETAGGQAESRFSTGKTRATQTLGTVAQALKSSSQQLRDQQHEGMGGYADQAANKLEEMSHYLENASLKDVATRFENFARREPALFIGSAVALGFFGARFLKSSQRHQQRETNMQQGFQGRSQADGAEQGIREPGGAWQNAGDRDVTPAPRPEWKTVGSDRSTNLNENAADRMGRA
jgi:hypothetical protein